MANEISIALSLSATKSNLSISRDVSFNADLAGAAFSHHVQNIGTTEEAIAIAADVATVGWTYFRNLDATNYVEIGVVEGGTFRAFVKLLAGKACVLPLGTTAPYAKANTAAVNLESMILAA